MPRTFMDQNICLEMDNTACGVCVCFVLPLFVVFDLFCLRCMGVSEEDQSIGHTSIELMIMVTKDCHFFYTPLTLMYSFALLPRGY